MPSEERMEATVDSDDSLSWEDFFGTTTADDLVPTLLRMYDTLVGRTQEVGSLSTTPTTAACCRPQEPPPPPPIATAVPRPLSVSSIASSSSSSSSSVASCSSGGRRLAGVVKGSAYLASIESLEDSEDEQATNLRPTPRSLGSGDSGVCSPCSYISSPSPPHTKPRYCDPHLTHMDRAVMEIVDTEGVYVNDLRQVIIGYLERWETCTESPLSDTQLQHLFSNIRDIFNFNSSFLRELEQCELNPTKVAQAFVRNNEGFSIYTEYCTNYPRTVSVLTELMRQESTARLFRERQAGLQHTLPLGSYLLKPVQRILKYHLLLENMVKDTESNSEEHGAVVKALSTMTAIAHHINEMKRKHEHAVRVQEIQSLLLGWQGEDLTTFGELCAEGTFRMAGAKANRHAFLFDQILLITKNKGEGILGYKAHIMCSNLMLIESVPGEPLSFHVIPFDNPRLQYTLQANSLEQKREWTLQLKRVILENYNAVIPSHARQLVMQLGQNRSDDEILAERATPKKQHSAPEYLERRKQERERRKSETGLRARLRTRSRKSDSGASLKIQQRIRRSSQFNEGKSLATAEDNMDQCGVQRRKSEPGCYSNSALSTEDIPEPEEPPPAPELRIEEPPPQPPEEEPPQEKKKSLEEIVSQLLMQNKEFQRVLKKQRHITRRHRPETSDEEDEGGVKGFVASRSTRSLSLSQREADYDNLQNVWNAPPELKRAQSFTSEGYEPSSMDGSLSGSRASFNGGPTSPAVWLKQQQQHLATPTSTKAGSLPRGFQLGTPDWYRARVSPERPFTIASDKPQELNLEDMQHYVDAERSNPLTRHRFPLPDDTTEEDSTPDTSMHHLNVHPEYKIYRPSLTKTALKQVISTVSGKLAGIRLSSETLDQLETENRANRLMIHVFSKSFKHRKMIEGDLPCYKQGSSSLGARIANGTETSDYADPKTLFQNITPSKKAASLLGIRPYSVLSLVSNLTSSSSGYSGSNGSTKENRKADDHTESDGSADSFYERTFEAIEASMEGEVCRDSAIFSEPEDLIESFAPKLPPRIPPPVPEKPANLKALLRLSQEKSNETTPSTERPEDECDSSSVASTVIEATATKGWVKHVICKIQGDSNH